MIARAQAGDLIAEYEAGGGGPTTNIGTLALGDAGATYEMFWIETMPSIKLLHPGLNVMYDYVGDKDNGGLCCLENDACGGDKDLFSRCLQPLDENLKQFVLNLDYEKSACRGIEKDIPRPRTIWDNIFLKAPAILWEHLVKAFGWPIMAGCVAMLVGLNVLVMYMLLGGQGGKGDKKN